MRRTAMICALAMITGAGMLGTGSALAADPLQGDLGCVIGPVTPGTVTIKPPITGTKHARSKFKITGNLGNCGGGTEGGNDPFSAINHGSFKAAGYTPHNPSCSPAYPSVPKILKAQVRWKTADGPTAGTSKIKLKLDSVEGFDSLVLVYKAMSVGGALHFGPTPDNVVNPAVVRLVSVESWDDLYAECITTGFTGFTVQAFDPVFSDIDSYIKVGSPDFP